MSEKAKVKETTRLYSRIWQLPTHREMLARLGLLVVIASVVMVAGDMISGLTSQPIQLLMVYLVVLAIPAYLGTLLLYVLIRRESSPLDLRRTTGVIQFGVIIWYSFGIIGRIVGLVLGTGFVSRFWILGANMGYLMFVFLVDGLSEYGTIRNSLAAFIPVLLWIVGLVTGNHFMADLMDFPATWPIVLFGGGTIIAFAVAYIYDAISKPFERDLGIDGPALLRGFGYDYLANDSRPLENMLTGISERQNIPIDVLVLKNDDDDLIGIGVVLYVHPGPFRNLGSSALPSYISEHIRERYGVPSFVMHGSCTHHQNLTTKEDFEKVTEELDRLIEKQHTLYNIRGPTWKESGKFKTWSLGVGRKALTIVTSAPQFTDDISLKVGMKANQAAVSASDNIERVAVVDAHNCINDNAVSVMSGDAEAEEFVQAVREAVVDNSEKTAESFGIGFYQTSPKGITKEDGLGPGGISVIILEVGSEQIAFISIDGNNMVLGMRQEILDSLKAIGIEEAEPITTDTHVVNAISLSSGGYPPVGQYKRQKIMEEIVDAVRQTCSRIRPGRVAMESGTIANLRTFGEKGFDTLTQDIVEATEIAKRTGIAAAAGSFLVTLILTFVL
ncbi:MAG: DUF2070 family protein [Promethearchaeia archaeon]